MFSAHQQVDWGKGDVYCRALGGCKDFLQDQKSSKAARAPALAWPRPLRYLQAKGES